MFKIQYRKLLIGKITITTLKQIIRGVRIARQKPSVVPDVVIILCFYQ